MSRCRRAKRRGIALVIVILLTLLVQCLVGVLVTLAVARTRIAADRRLAIEGDLVVRHALTQARRQFATATSIPEGVPQHLDGSLPGGWHWSVAVIRRGDLAELRATAQRQGAGGAALAGSRGTLLLRRGASDTLLRLPTHAGW